MPKKRTDGTQYSQAQTDGDEDVLAPESKTDVNDAEIEEAEADVNVAEFARRMNLEILYSGDNQIIHFCTFNISRPVSQALPQQDFHQEHGKEEPSPATDT